MKSQPPTRILGIDPGTKNLGTAVLEGQELIHHAVFDVSAMTPHGSVEHARRIVGRLISAYQPDTLAIEKTFFARGRHIALLRAVAEEIQGLAGRRGLRIVAIAPSSLKKAVTGDGHASKDEVARSVCRGFPQLRAFLRPDRKWKDRYHANMFDAVAVAAVVLRDREATRASESP